MSTIDKFLMALSCVALLSGCSRAAKEMETSGRFIRCWEFRPIFSGTYEIDFQAIVYPREGVLSYNQACPALTLQMIFNDISLPSGVQAFRRADENLELVGFQGRAIVSIEGQENPNVLRVSVERLISGEDLTENETARMVAAMRR